MKSKVGAESKEKIVGKILSEVYQIEQEKHSKYTVFDVTDRPKQLYECFVKLKLLLRRIEFDLPGEKEFYVYTEQMRVSEYMIGWIIQYNLIRRRHACMKLVEVYGQEGKRQEASYFRRLQAEVEDL